MHAKNLFVALTSRTTNDIMITVFVKSRDIMEETNGDNQGSGFQT